MHLFYYLLSNPRFEVTEKISASDRVEIFRRSELTAHRDMESYACERRAMVG